jgi:ATP-binding cassette subfamily F protein uup
VRRGTNQTVAYFDQLREQLDPQATLVDTINPGAEFVEVAGKRVHVMTYLGDFLFAPERARSPVSSLSGGERNRLLLARLFAQPANVLVLDEPTNDLDIETLELLEALLQDYRGTLFLVSHDRAFLDNVVTQTIAFEEYGKLVEYPGGYSDWAEYQARRAAAQERDAASGVALAVPPLSELRTTERKLGFNEQRELAELPAQIEALEAATGQLRDRFADPAVYREGAAAVKALQEELLHRESELAARYARWEALELRASAIATATGN